MSLQQETLHHLTVIWRLIHNYNSSCSTPVTNIVSIMRNQNLLFIIEFISDLLTLNTLSVHHSWFNPPNLQDWVCCAPQGVEQTWRSCSLQTQTSS